MIVPPPLEILSRGRPPYESVPLRKSEGALLAKKILRDLKSWEGLGGHGQIVKHYRGAWTDSTTRPNRHAGDVPGRRETFKNIMGGNKFLSG